MATSKPRPAAPAPAPRPEAIPDEVLIRAADTIHGEPLTGHTVTGGHVTAKNAKGQIVSFAHEAIVSRMRELSGDDDDQVVDGDGGK